MSTRKHVCTPKFVFFNEKKIKDFNDFERQVLALFDTSPLHQFAKFNNFLWVY